MSIILFIIVLGVLVFVHELGHFLAAKRSGVRVDEFGLGFPPRLASWRRGETTYSLNLLLFGGFVKIFGEDPDQESLAGADSARSLARQSRRVQARILIAGVTMNWLLAWLFLSFGFLTGLPVAVGQYPAASVDEARLLITTVKPGSPAARALLKTGDEIISVRTGLDALPALSPESVAGFVAAHPVSTLDFTIQRAGQTSDFNIKPAEGIVGGRAAVGIGMDEVVTARFGPFSALWHGWRLTSDLTVATVYSLGTIVKQAFAGKAVLDNITGPVGLAGLVGDAAHLGWVYLLSFVAFISINLAVLNLLPFPALDGGRLLFLLIEKIKGSRISPRVANTLNTVGFALLLLLMAVVTYGDIKRLLS